MPPDPDTGIGAFHYRKGAVFLCAVAAVHRDPNVYPDPEAFRIERFFEGYTAEMSPAEHGRLVMENARKLEAARRLLTFGGGQGTCPGRGFNMLEFFLVLDALLPRFVFALEHPEREVTDYVEIITGPEPGKLGGRIRRRPEFAQRPLARS
jgi:cytochrome P450/NADPH-cytochrome P450 reductase